MTADEQQQLKVSCNIKQTTNVLISETTILQMAAPSIRLITTSKAPAATGYSQAVLVNNQTLYVSGQTGMISGKTDVVPGGARAEAKQAMTNIGEILTYAGSSFKHGNDQLQHMVTNMNDFQDVNETFKNFFTADTYPARSFFQVVKLPKNALVMIDAVAVVAGHWICSDVWMDILPSFNRPQLGLNLALLSDRFDVLVDKHFDGKPTKLTIWRTIEIDKDIGPKTQLSVWIDGKLVAFPLPNRPLPIKIRFKNLRIKYIDHSNGHQLLPDGIADDGPNATAGQALTKWLYTPSKNGQPKRLQCYDDFDGSNLEWINNFKETFLSATTSSSYIIHLIFHTIPTPTKPFELVNERTNEKLTLWKKSEDNWLLKRCPIIGEKKDENWDDNLNNVQFNLWRGINCQGCKKYARKVAKIYA
ncbi:hypothetical protein niasHT_019110 [Heterodera trifolii]|uniref:Uncharacterized protein n=1 Tax=Heterodera trifolii TaxID=157864 RepID=A0ABD2KYC6_9BILA